MKKVFIAACILLINIHNQISASNQGSRQRCLDGQIRENTKSTVYNKEILDRNGTVVRSEKVAYDQASYPQRNGKETIHLYPEHIVIMNDDNNTETYKVRLKLFRGNSSYKLPDGRTVRFTESSIKDGIKNYDMPRVEKEWSCLIS